MLYLSIRSLTPSSLILEEMHGYRITLMATASDLLGRLDITIVLTGKRELIT